MVRPRGLLWLEHQAAAAAPTSGCTAGWLTVMQSDLGAAMLPSQTNSHGSPGRQAMPIWSVPGLGKSVSTNSPT
jgi:hypothetical protein